MNVFRPLPGAQQLADAASAGISVQGASVTYRNGHTALYDASFELPRGTITALVGVNGSGKSTLFKAIMGLVPLAAGRIRVLGLSADKALRQRCTAYVPQTEEVDWDFPVLVEDVVMMGRYGHMGPLRIARKADHQAVAEALERVGMSALRHRQIGELSGGQRKRVFLARSLAQDSQVILLDEPFTGVDVKTEDQIIELLGELRDEGRILLVSTHNLGSVPEFCDRVALIKRTVLACGPTDEVYTQANLERAFGGVLRHFALPNSPSALHTPVGVFSDDERPLILRNGLPARRDGDGEVPDA
ncbi:manganese/iron ABC transporter ATP-binding protein [Halopseudomonas pachastrellae]|uniref:manganese/iron ABC transporter ATP-binding protein n=1 Tax=Halopseudomonas pachastrellae TaxID=254161 RepID=UPI003D7E34F3|tara:strand:+ start:90 stop:995 length:906 start_codon:yes stop_codon:yes gene_type:complete